LTNPCRLSVISTAPTTVENLIAFAGYTVTSQAKYLYDDEVSIARREST